MKKLIFLLILPIFLGLIFSGCYYPTRVVYVPTEETFAPSPPAVSLEPIFFDFNKSNITPDAKAILDKNAEWISKNPTAKIQIVGNCDERATNKYNMDLGKRRAIAAKQYLVNLGISADRLSTVSRGKEKPLDPGHNETAWAENRRVAFNVAGEILGEQIKPLEEMDYRYPIDDRPYPYPYYPWGYYDPWWGYPYWWGGLGFSYYYYPHSYYYGGYYRPWYGYYGGYYGRYHGGHHGGGYHRGYHGGGSHGGGHRR